MDIIDTAKEIRSDILKNKTVPNNDKQINFKSKYTTFYQMLIKPDMDNEMFEKFCVLMQSVKSGNCSSFDGAAKFSEFGAQKYIYKNMPEPSESEKQTAYKKLRSKQS